MSSTACGIRRWSPTGVASHVMLVPLCRIKPPNSNWWEELTHEQTIKRNMSRLKTTRGAILQPITMGQQHGFIYGKLSVEHMSCAYVKCLNCSVRGKWPEVQFRTVLIFVCFVVFLFTALQPGGEPHLRRHFSRILDSLLTFPGVETDLGFPRGKVKKNFIRDIKKRDSIINIHSAHVLSGVAAENMGKGCPLAGKISITFCVNLNQRTGGTCESAPPPTHQAIHQTGNGAFSHFQHESSRQSVPVLVFHPSQVWKSPVWPIRSSTKQVRIVFCLYPEQTGPAQHLSNQRGLKGTHVCTVHSVSWPLIHSARPRFLLRWSTRLSPIWTLVRDCTANGGRGQTGDGRSKGLQRKKGVGCEERRLWRGIK